MSALLNGDAIFGQSVIVEMVPAENEAQVTAFFGLTGLYSLDGGGRGRMITVSGVAYGDSGSDLGSFQALMGSFADGVGRELYDTILDVVYTNVVFRGGFQWTGAYGYNGGLILRPYRAVFHGMI